jgi:class 3 adenylate cyclase
MAMGPFLDVDGARVPLTAAFKIGRAANCSLTFDDIQVSREHALIAHDPGSAGWLLIDLGSSNGTRLNGSLISRPTPLRHEDRIQIGLQWLVFRDPHGVGPHQASPATAGTVIAVEVVDRWLLLGDIQGSTGKWAELPADDLSHGIRAWLRTCEASIAATGGWVNEYLGDGFLALWKAEAILPERLVGMLRELEAMPVEHGMNFRFILHRAELRSGLGVSSGIEKLAGLELNYLFKSEKPVAALGRRLVLSEAAVLPLQRHAAFRSLGTVEVPGFHQPRPLFELAGP